LGGKNLEKNFENLGLENFERTASWLGFMIEITPREEGGNYSTQEGRANYSNNILLYVYFNINIVY